MKARHAVVVGASRGLGEAVARRMAADGWCVSIGARSKDRLDATSQELKRNGCEVWASRVEVSNADSVTNFFAGAVEHYGPPTGVVHSAARYGPFSSVLHVESNDWIRTIDINLNGTFYVLRAASAAMDLSKSGSIVVLSGGGATSPMPTVSAYAASKAGVVRLVETFSRELRETGIKINAVAPGLMATDMLEEIISVDSQVLDPGIRQQMIAAKESGKDSMPIAVEAIRFLLNNPSELITGRLISAMWDPWREWANDPTPFLDEDAFTLRRQLPKKNGTQETRSS